ncbi:unnamed protein product [Spirodela intermedia]|uniref:Uncharacterized protein n=1 Tax=Spirodela intermedia TaxID=51605 RepID=A0A7I8J0S7_SPIIN|nr:unnamed protein product [Spirodela intermedia]CAA6663747.1 unnamed protein product [Spirodela intermedia]
MAAGEGGAAAARSLEELHPDVVTSVLRLLDGRSLAAASCSAPLLRALSVQPHLWESLCLRAWPSLHHHRLRSLLPCFPHSHRSFFSDAYPYPHPGSAAVPSPEPPPPALVWAVDLFHGGEPLLSRVMETDPRGPGSSAPRSASTPSTARGCGGGGGAGRGGDLPESLELSWVVIDPARRRAANLSSRRPVSVKRHWYTGEIHLRFAVVLGEDGAAAAVASVTCGSGGATTMLQLREVSLTVEDADGKCLTGRHSLVLLLGLWRGGGGAPARRLAGATQITWRGGGRGRRRGSERRRS